MRTFKQLTSCLDLEWQFIDGSIIKAHQHSSGASGKADQAIGQSRGGLTTKVHMAVVSFGLPIDFKVTGGQVHDSKVAPELISMLPQADYVIADKGYDSDSLRSQIIQQGSKPIIPRKRNYTKGNVDIDWLLYRHRHLVENVFARLKYFRAIATRYDKLKRNYASMLALDCAFIWLLM